MDVPQVSGPAPRPAACRCGAGQPAGVPPHRCLGQEARDHTRRVSTVAGLLVARMEAVRVLGTLTGELRPLSSFAG